MVFLFSGPLDVPLLLSSFSYSVDTRQVFVIIVSLSLSAYVLGVVEITCYLVLL